jgi:hypothetical protein
MAWLQVTFNNLFMRAGGAMPESSKRVEQCVENLCKAGCGRVYVYIEALQQDEIFPEVVHLSPVERKKVLDQLVAIMKVYGGGVCDG